MTGDTLWDLYEKYRKFTTSDSVLEIGPGYGRLLRTAIDRKVPLACYIGVDLSEARIDKLRREFQVEKIRFVQGDIDTWRGATPFNVVLSSATFEHLHPDCRAALRNIHGQLLAHGQVFIDFIPSDSSRAGFDAPGSYVRAYPAAELAAIFAECQYTVHAIETWTIGQGSTGPVDRLVVIAEKA